MECPDIDRLIDLAIERETDHEMEAHLLLCAECWADVEMLQMIREAGIWARENGLWEGGTIYEVPEPQGPDLAWGGSPALFQFGRSSRTGGWQ